MPRAGLDQYHAGVPIDQVIVDVPGPLLGILHENSIILMLIDQFTRWMDYFPLPDQLAELIA